MEWDGTSRKGGRMLINIGNKEKKGSKKKTGK
jgi:hypothetical protein